MLNELKKDILRMLALSKQDGEYETMLINELKNKTIDDKLVAAIQIRLKHINKELEELKSKWF